MAGRPRDAGHSTNSGEDPGGNRSPSPGASWSPLIEFIFGSGAGRSRYRSLRWYTYRNMSPRLRREVDPDEVLHEVCISSRKDFASLREDARREKWIKRAIRNRICNLARTSVRRKRDPPRGRSPIRLDAGEDGSPAIQVPSQRPSPDEIAMIKEDLERVEEKLDLLSEKQSVLIGLVYFRGTSLPWAASRLGMTDARASRLKYEAIHALRKLLGRDEADGGGRRTSKKQRSGPPRSGKRAAMDCRR
jgi:RNA polymerase sigma-70 factor (ECF subfamily)